MFPQYILIFHSLIRFITVYLYCTWHDKLLIIRSNSPWVPSILLKEFFEQPRPNTFYIFIFYGLTMCCMRKENITSITKTVNKLSHNKLRYIYFPSKEGKGSTDLGLKRCYQTIWFSKVLGGLQVDENMEHVY